MIDKLRLAVSLRETEIATSFFSRLAAANGVESMHRFCRILGLHPTKLELGDGATISAAAQYGGVSPELLQEYSVSKTRSEVRVGCFITGKHMLASGIRFCPCCVVQDLAEPDNYPESRPSIRAVWRVAWIDRCPIHGLMLENRPTESEVYRDDFCAYVRDHRDEVLRLSDAARDADTHPFDDYIHQRLVGQGTEVPLLGELAPHVSAEVCEAVGAVDLFPYDAPLKLLERSALTAACRRGFEIVSESNEAIFDYFARRIASDNSENFGRNPVYGPLYRLLQYRMKKPEYATIIKGLRDQAIPLLALGPGDNFLGPVDRRVTYSVRTASRELGLNARRLRKVLAAEGRLPENHMSLTNGRLVVPADLAIELFSRDGNSISVRELETLTGMRADKIEELISAGVPIAKSGNGQGDGLYVRYFKPDIIAFMDRVYPKLAVNKLRGGYVTLRSASSSIGLTIAGLLALIYHGQINDIVRLGRHRKPTALRVNQKEVWNWRADNTSLGYSVRQVAKLLRTSDFSASFLLKSGLLQSTIKRNPINRQQQRYVSPRDLDEFRSSYISLWELAQIRKIKIGLLRPELEAAGIWPVLEPPPKLARYYRRSEVFPS